MVDELVIALVGIGAGGMGFSLAWFFLGPKEAASPKQTRPVPMPAEPKAPAEPASEPDLFSELVTASPQQQEEMALASS